MESRLRVTLTTKQSSYTQQKFKWAINTNTQFRSFCPRKYCAITRLHFSISVSFLVGVCVWVYICVTSAEFGMCKLNYIHCFVIVYSTCYGSLFFGYTPYSIYKHFYDLFRLEHQNPLRSNKRQMQIKGYQIKLK